MSKTILDLTREINMFFKLNNIDARPVIRLKDKEAGLRLCSILEKEIQTFSLNSLRLGEDIGYVDINEVRIVWPMK